MYKFFSSVYFVFTDAVKDYPSPLVNSMVKRQFCQCVRGRKMHMRMLKVKFWSGN